MSGGEREGGVGGKGWEKEGERLQHGGHRAAGERGRDGCQLAEQKDLTGQRRDMEAEGGRKGRERQK